VKWIVGHVFNHFENLRNFITVDLQDYYVENEEDGSLVPVTTVMPAFPSDPNDTAALEAYINFIIDGKALGSMNCARALFSFLQFPEHMQLFQATPQESYPQVIEQPSIISMSNVENSHEWDQPFHRIDSMLCDSFYSGRNSRNESVDDGFINSIPRVNTDMDDTDPRQALISLLGKGLVIIKHGKGYFSLVKQSTNPILCTCRASESTKTTFTSL
jgi:hypothetical protein